MIRENFAKSPSFSFRNNLFYQNDFHSSHSFEACYIAIRNKEGRLYTDDDVVTLPYLPGGHPRSREWKRRAFTMRRLIEHVKRGKGRTILEVGCGNGWLCRHIANLPGTEVAGVDVNETELLQAARVFSNVTNLTFIYANILHGLPFKQFDHIILSASLQYFADVYQLLSILFEHLADQGQIHIVDTPLYSPSAVLDAANRSAEYFTGSGIPEMAHHYHHHTFQSIAGFNPKVNYDPATFLNRVRRKLAVASPFPWIIIESAR